VSTTFHLKEAKFRIPFELRAKALKELEENRRTRVAFETLPEAFEAFGWEVNVDSTDTGGSGDIDDIRLAGERLYLDESDRILTAIAPFVLGGSFIHVYNECGQHWRWDFNGATCRRLEGRVVFEA
jgi:hypothetical protein